MAEESADASPLPNEGGDEEVPSPVPSSLSPAPDSASPVSQGEESSSPSQQPQEPQREPAPRKSPPKPSKPSPPPPPTASPSSSSSASQPAAATRQNAPAGPQEKKARDLLDQAERKVRSTQSFFGGLFGYVCNIFISFLAGWYLALASAGYTASAVVSLWL